MKDHVARMLREIGSPCGTVVEIEETTSTYFITCEVEQDGVANRVVYTVPKRE